MMCDGGIGWGIVCSLYITKGFESVVREAVAEET